MLGAAIRHTAVEVIPVLRDFFDLNRRHRGERKLRLWREDGQWKLRIDGNMRDPFAPQRPVTMTCSAASKPSGCIPSGLRYRALGPLLDEYPGSRLQGRVRVRALPRRPQIAEAQLDLTTGTAMTPGRMR